ncbi:hypothetical protein [Nesterenkonia alba]|uniref:hypothetical protein n=1 Tax=Nesterenkonia alba TaxID=515814 RepID=UPI000420C250|nr:hypothetical protein [Nesterenkonia alba]
MSPRSQPRPVVATRPMARRTRRRRTVAALGLTAALIAGTTYGAWRYIDENEYLLDARCEVQVGEHQQRLSPEQADSAALLAATAVERQLPPAAAVHAVAMSLQETELQLRADDPDPGERELFARGRPAWSDQAGAEQVPVTVNGFFDLLEERYEAALAAEEESEDEDDDAEDTEDEDSAGEYWQPEMELDVASEALDRPHNAQFYPEHYDRSRAFAAPLAGQSQVDFSCTLSQLEVPGPDPEGTAEELIAVVPTALEIPFTEPEDDDEDEGDEDGETEDDDVAPEPLPEGIVEVTGSGEEAVVTVTAPPADEFYDYQWMVAHWAVASAERFGIQSVTAGSQQWTRDNSHWESTDEPTEADTVVIGFTRDI